MKNNILKINNDTCTGCGICEVICPTKAIKIILNEDGFYIPKMDNDKCIDCGKCLKTCIKFNIPILEDNIKKVFAAKNKNKEILKKSSSGGVSHELMKKALEKGYKIVGVTYNKNKEIAETKIVNTEKELDIFFGSKYMQSYTVEALKEIKNNPEDKYAIFGTPCQIYSIYKYAELNSLRENFIFIDLFCHGCPSMNLWKKYVEGKKKEYKCETFDDIEFRSKCHGWHEYSYKFKSNVNTITSKKIKDEFNEIFFDNNIFSRSCYKCKIRGMFSYHDIRLGDFWGKTYDNDIEGVSAVVISSNRGERIFDEIKEKFEVKEHRISEILPYQSCQKEHKEDKEKRKILLNILKSNKDINEIYQENWKNYSLKKKLKKNIINFIKQNFSRKTINFIRKLSH